MKTNNMIALDAAPMPASDIARIIDTASPAFDAYLGESIYFNNDPGYLAAVRGRLAATARLHSEKVGDKPAWLLRAPGRLNAFLEYLDMCAGDHMSTTIDGDLPICVSVRDDDIVRTINSSPEFEDDEFSISKEIVLFRSAPWSGPACQGLEDNWDNRTRIYPYYGHKQGEWMNYVRSSFLRVAWEMPDVRLRGVDITFGETSIPLRGGTSSSSAIVVLSFLALYIANRDRLPDWTIQRICTMLGEAEWYVGTHGGANDQTTILRNVANGVLYNRHSRPELDSDILPSLKGVRMVVVNSLWEANKSLGANHVFNLRKGWMDLGDDLMKLIISAVQERLHKVEPTGDGWLHEVMQGRFGYTIYDDVRTIASKPELWHVICRNYNKFGSLDEGLLGVPNAAIDELIRLLPEEIEPGAAAWILGKDQPAMERDYTLPYPEEGGYRPRAAAAFFHKENMLGREIETLFIEADLRLASSEITVDSPEYKEYQIRVGKILEELQDTLRDDFQVSNSQLDMLLDIAKHGPGYLGGKLTGAGSGGCVVVMVREGTEQAFCEYLNSEYYNKPEHFIEYRKRISELDSEMGRSLEANLNNALADISAQRRPVTFSSGACIVDVTA